MAVRAAGRWGMTAAESKVEPDAATGWGRCRGCGLPGLAYLRQFDAATARCGFCGDQLRPTGTDLSRQAAAVIAAPIHHRGRDQ